MTNTTSTTVTDVQQLPDHPVRILVIDNYDSFVYNLVQYVGTIADEVLVRRNDAVSIAEIRSLAPDGLIISPGPGHPTDAGVSMAAFAELQRPILGVCLGHQALCAVHGAPITHAPTVVHGKPSTLTHDGRGLFVDLPETLRVGRYHSLAVDRTDLPAPLVETARTITGDERIQMGVRHRHRPHFGVQFHPESILTGRADGTDTAALDIGHALIERFCRYAAAWRGSAPSQRRVPTYAPDGDSV